MSNLKKLLIRITAPAVVALPALNVLAQAQNAPVLNPVTSVNNLDSVATTISKWATMFAGVIGIIAVVMLIYAAFLYVTGGTDEGNIKKAKGIIIYAIIGIVIAVLSYAIVRVVINVAGSV